MAKPKEVNLNKQQQKQVLNLYKGSKQTEPVTGARKISEMVGVSRYQVMLFLEKQGLKKYSASTYS